MSEAGNEREDSSFTSTCCTRDNGTELKRNAGKKKIKRDALSMPVQVACRDDERGGCEETEG